MPARKASYLARRERPAQGQFELVQHVREARKLELLAAEPRGHAEIRQLGCRRGKFAGGKRSGKLQRRLARRFAATGAFQLAQHALIEERGGLSGRTLVPQADFGRAHFPRPIFQAKSRRSRKRPLQISSTAMDEERQQDRRPGRN